MRGLHLPQQIGVAEEIRNQTSDLVQVTREAAKRPQHVRVILLVPAGTRRGDEHLEDHSRYLDVPDGEVPHREDLQLSAVGRSSQSCHAYCVLLALHRLRNIQLSYQRGEYMQCKSLITHMENYFIICFIYFAERKSEILFK